jgi:transposase-like protein
MFQDEARFGRINIPRSCWAPKGTRPIVGSQVIREYTYVYSAVSPVDGALDSLILPSVNTGVFALFLEEVSQRHSEEFVIMFVDGAGWHTTKELTLPKNLSVAFLPPYSPELNPAEHIWDCIRENWFQNKTFNSLDAVEETLVEALVSLENDQSRIQSLTGFNWIVNNVLIAT